jgi:hypothetical protein
VAATRLVPLVANRLDGRWLHHGRIGSGRSTLHPAGRADTASVLGGVVVAVFISTTLAAAVAGVDRARQAVDEVGPVTLRCSPSARQAARNCWPPSGRPTRPAAQPWP